MSKPFNTIKKELELMDTMPFGKYQGLTLARVIKDDPRYLMWLIKNSTQFFMSHTAVDALTTSFAQKMCTYKFNPCSKRYRDPIDYDMDDIFEQEFVFF